MPSTVTDRIDGVTTSAAVKTPVAAVSTAQITLSGVQTIDGVLLTAYSGPGLPCDRVLVAGQTDSTTNGIYLVQTGAWTREPDFDGARDVVTGTIVEVRNGTTYQNTFWKCTCTDNPIVIGTSLLTFTQFNIYQFVQGTSVTSNTIGTGAKTFATQGGLAYKAGMWLQITDTANSANYMIGQVTSYDAVAGTLVMNITVTAGAGTKTSWSITVSGAPSATGLIAANNLSDVANAATARTNLAVPGLSTTNTFTGSQLGSTTALTSSTNSIAVNFALNNNFSHAFTENTTLANPTNCSAGQDGHIEFTQSSVVKTLAFGSSWKFASAVTPSVTATSGAKDTLYYSARSSIFIEANLVKAFG